MKKYGTAQTFGFFSANCGGRKLRQPDGNNRSRGGGNRAGAGQLKSRKGNRSRGRNNQSRTGTTKREQPETAQE
ncbi:hypothetical protein, partial [Alistipes finegoldii]|uniref:hypothetical protein n=1 Tax=Alistipes finegoldii TaxID=214856 RepID=UPI003AB622E9